MDNVVAIERANLKISLVGRLASSQMSQKALDVHQMLRDVGASDSIWRISFLRLLHLYKYKIIILRGKFNTKKMIFLI